MYRRMNRTAAALAIPAAGTVTNASTLPPGARSPARLMSDVVYGGGGDQ